MRDQTDKYQVHHLDKELLFYPATNLSTFLIVVDDLD